MIPNEGLLLNERKIKILEAIINDYIQTAEPIGSRTIAKKYDLGISSATIRNEMSDLEEMGLIIQPHASAGRIPSDAGYRLYVDNLMSHRELTTEEIQYMQKIIAANVSQIHYLMQETARAIAMMTHYTTIVSEPQEKRTAVKQLQLLPVDEHSVVMVLVTDNKVVKNRFIYLEHVPDSDSLNLLSTILNHNLHGLTLYDINADVIERIRQSTEYVDEPLFVQVLNAIVDIIQAEDDIKVYTNGVKNILAFPEFSDIEKAKVIFQALEEKEMLLTMLGQDTSDSIRVIIGSENNLTELKNCSVIKSNLIMGGQNYGSIGIIGPTRMDYSQVVSVLDGIMKNINVVINALTGG